VRVRFLSADAERRWEVLSNDAVLCTTPCDRWLDPSMALAMRSETSFFQKNAVTVPDLHVAPAGASLDVRAYPLAWGRFAGGVNLVTFGGLGVAAGIALTAVGCANRTGLCTGGAITLPLSAALLVPGIWLLSGSSAHAEVTAPREARDRGPRVTVGPGGVAGVF
jgi:hypothetical protein